MKRIRMAGIGARRIRDGGQGGDGGNGTTFNTETRRHGDTEPRRPTEASAAPRFARRQATGAGRGKPPRLSSWGLPLPAPVTCCGRPQAGLGGRSQPSLHPDRTPACFVLLRAPPAVRVSVYDVVPLPPPPPFSPSLYLRTSTISPVRYHALPPQMVTQTQAPPAPMTFREVLELTVMRRVWIAQVVSLLGDFLALFAVISVVTYRMLGTPQQVTGVQIAYMLPLALLGPLSGVFVDRWPLKPTLVSSDLVRAGLVLLLFVATSMWQIYVVLCLLSCVSSFFGPAQSGTIRSHVPANGLMSANALMQMAMMGTRIVAPAAA